MPEDKELFVYCHWYSRGDDGVQKFRVLRSEIEKAVSLRGPSESDAEQESFLEEINKKYNGVWDYTFFSTLVFPDNPEKAETPNYENGFGVWHEEAEYGVGPTKDAARVEYTKIHVEEQQEDGDDNW